MPTPVYIGDEVSAGGYRLAGMRVHVPQPEDILQTINTACEEAPLVILSSSIAQQLAHDDLESLLAGVSPPVVILPDVRGYAPMQDLSTRLRRQLGVLE